MKYFQMRVKSREKLAKLFAQPHYRPDLTGYRNTITTTFINGTMIEQAGQIILVKEYNNRGYSYDSHYSWAAEWLEEVNPIWLPLKDKK